MAEDVDVVVLLTELELEVVLTVFGSIGVGVVERSEGDVCVHEAISVLMSKSGQVSE